MNKPALSILMLLFAVATRAANVEVGSAALASALRLIGPAQVAQLGSGSLSAISSKILDVNNKGDLSSLNEMAEAMKEERYIELLAQVTLKDPDLQLIGKMLESAAKNADDKADAHIKFLVRHFARGLDEPDKYIAQIERLSVSPHSGGVPLFLLEIKMQLQARAAQRQEAQKERERAAAADAAKTAELFAATKRESSGAPTVWTTGFDEFAVKEKLTGAPVSVDGRIMAARLAVHPKNAGPAQGPQFRDFDLKRAAREDLLAPALARHDNAMVEAAWAQDTNTFWRHVEASFKKFEQAMDSDDLGFINRHPKGPWAMARLEAYRRQNAGARRPDQVAPRALRRVRPEKGSLRLRYSHEKRGRC